MRMPVLGTACLVAIATLAGCRTVDHPKSPVEIRAADNRAHGDWQKLDFHVGGLATWVAPDPVVVREEILTARRSQDDFGRPTVILQFDQNASTRMETISINRSSRPVAVLVDGEIIAAPILTTPVQETLVVTFGKDTGGATDADRLVEAAGGATSSSSESEPAEE